MRPNGYYVGWVFDHTPCGTKLLTVVEHQGGLVTFRGACACGLISTTEDDVNYVKHSLVDLFTSPGESGPQRNTDSLMRFSRPEYVSCGCAICTPRKNTAHERLGWDTSGKNERLSHVW